MPAPDALPSPTRPTRALLGALLAVLVLGPCASAEPARAVGPVPKALRAQLQLDPFYAKHVDLAGFPILSSRKVSDYALLEAAYVIEHMLAKRPDVLKALIANRVRCTVMAWNELTTDVPEHATLEPGRFWDHRARGLGASQERPCISCAEENVLGYPGDPYATESILVHEFAHAIDLMGLRRIEPDFAKSLQAAYDAAIEAGLWKGLYAAENKEEYWAEGVQSWFHTNRPPDAIHNHVDTRAELEAYDPRLAKLIRAALGENEWLYVRPALRKQPGHLAGFDRAKAPRFAWPKDLVAWYRRYKEDLRTGAGRVELARLERDKSPAHSPTTFEETRILFMNETGQRLRIYWLDYAGKRKSYGEVGVGKNAERSTLVEHIWVLTDVKGVEIARFAAGREPGRAVVRKR